MDDKNLEYSLTILSELGHIPSVPFHEKWMSNKIKSELQSLEISWEEDPYKNIIACIPGKIPSTPPQGLIYIAHMDHPGYEIVGIENDYLLAKPLGGIPYYGKNPGVKLIIVPDISVRINATIVKPSDNDPDLLLVQPQQQYTFENFPIATIFDLDDFKLEDDYIKMRALDDLAGCASILAVLKTISQNPPDTDVYGVFTVAEEVGLIGARLLASSNKLPKSLYAISIESSKTLPGAVIGSGPVIRVGDAGTTFNNEAESVLVKAKEKLSKISDTFCSQRQLMSGGVCEASAFSSNGYKSTGIAYPLANYHNGGDNEKIKSEYIHKDDFFNGVKLLHESAYQIDETTHTNFQRRFTSVPKDIIQRLS
ncbi:MAG TPA: hypothetical protein DEZ08_03760 [Dehalococcoidia bacterium]|jgi:putative aminopeptidase FrvX|nr:hypothetical protein [Dehalococcoidia bacterium]|tara:strand:+ start:2032 stop:3132 length:1101 start_codon:yes stop_codon:yes gene_type:complete